MNVEECLPMVRAEVRDAASRLPSHVDTDGLTSAAQLALVEAWRLYDPGLGVPFRAYAKRRVRGAILDEMRSRDWAPRALRGQIRERDDARAALVGREGRSPSRVELASELGVQPRALDRVDAAERASRVLHLDAFARADVAVCGGLSPEQELLSREADSYVRDAVASLPAVMLRVVRGTFFEGRTWAELAVELGVSESRVSQILRDALGVLRRVLLPLVVGGDASVSAPSRGATRWFDRYAADVAGRSSFVGRLSA